MKNKHLVIVALVALVSSIHNLVFAQCEAVVYDFSLAESQVGFDLLITPDGNYLAVGDFRNTANNSGSDIVAIMSDPLGNELWRRIYGWEGDDYAYGSILTSDGQVLITGRTAHGVQNSAVSGVLLMKIQMDGTLLWNKTFSIAPSAEHGGADLVETPDGEFVIAANYSYGQQLSANIPNGIYLLKTTSEGNLIQQQTYVNDIFYENLNANQPGHSSVSSVALAANGDYLFTGSTRTLPTNPWSWGGDGTYQISILRTASDFTPVWETHPVVTAGFTCFAPGGGDIQEDAAGSIYVIMNMTSGPITCYDAYPYSRLLKLDQAGLLIWDKPIFSNTSDCIIPTEDGHFCLSGSNQITKVDSSGLSFWKSATLPAFNAKGGNSLVQTSDGGYLLASHISNGVAFAQFDTLGNSCESLLFGSVFFDLDGDCQLDADETELQNWGLSATTDHIIVTSGLFSSYSLSQQTNSSGSYRFHVDNGPYEVEVYPPNALWEVGCPIDGIYTREVTESYQSFPNLNFGMTALESCPLLNLEVAMERSRVCTEGLVSVRYCNEGTLAQDQVSITIELGQYQTFIDASIPWTINANVLTFEVGTVGVNVCGQFTIRVQTACDAPLDAIACVYGAVMPANNCTLELGHDTDTLCRSIRNSYDPNDKLADVNDTEQCWSSALDKMEFTIRFQNTGNDTAYQVVILDTLEQNLDVNTLKRGPSSHAYGLKILGGNILMFTFTDINLPDSTTNLTESQGFVQFSIHPVANTPNGIVIENRAAIYFDYNYPIVTPAVYIHQCSSRALVIERIEKSKVTICDNPNGRIDVIAVGGTGGINYSIDNGINWQTGLVFENVPPGTYHVLVRDGHGQIAEYRYNPVVVEFALPYITGVWIGGSTTCGLADKTITVRAVDYGDVQFSIDGGITVQDNPVFTGLTAGTYTVWALNACGEGDYRTVTVTEPLRPTIDSVTVQQADCIGSNASIRIHSASIPNLNVRYSIDGGQTWGVNALASPLVPGEYNVMARNANYFTCVTAWDSTITILSVDTTLQFLGYTALPPTTCGGADGQFELHMNGANNLVSIDNGISFFTSIRTFEGLIPGTYPVIIRNECTMRDTTTIITIANTPPPIIESVEVVHPSQGSGSGMIIVEAYGGSNLEYSIDMGATWQTSPIFTGLAEGVYTIVVSDQDTECSTAIEITLLTVVGLSSIDEKADVRLDIYPNPASDRVVIDIQLSGIETIHLSVLDAAGRLLDQLHFNSILELNYRYDFGNYPSGTYWLQFDIGGRKVISKRIVLL